MALLLPPPQPVNIETERLKSLAGGSTVLLSGCWKSEIRASEHMKADQESNLIVSKGVSICLLLWEVGGFVLSLLNSLFS